MPATNPFKNTKPSTTAFYGPGQSQPTATDYNPAIASQAPLTQSQTPNLPQPGMQAGYAASSVGTASAPRPKTTPSVAGTPSQTVANSIPRQIPSTQAPVTGSAPSTRHQYEQQNQRLYSQSGGVGFGFGKPAVAASNRIAQGTSGRPGATPFSMAPTPQNRQIMQGLGRNSQQPGLLDAYTKPRELLGAYTNPAPEGYLGPNTQKFATPGATPSSPRGGGFATSSSALTGEGQDKGEGGEESQEGGPKTASDVWNMDGGPPADMNEFARRLRREGEKPGNEHLLLAARRVEALANEGATIDGDGNIRGVNGLKELGGNINDPDSWTEGTKEVFGDGDEPSANNLLETGTESWNSFKSSTNYDSLTPEQKAFADWAQQNGIAIDDDTGRMYDHGKVIGSIYDPTTYEGKALQGWDAAQKKAMDEDMAGWQKQLMDQIGGMEPKNINPDEMIRAMRLRRAQEEALNLRAAMEGGARAGMSPEGSQGLMSGLSAQSAIQGQAQEAQTQLQTQMFNAQKQMQQYQTKAQALMQLANMQHDVRMKRMAFEQAMRMQNAAQQWQAHMYELQSQVTGKDALNAVGGFLGTGLGMAMPALFGLGGPPPPGMVRAPTRAPKGSSATTGYSYSTTRINSPYPYGTGA